MASSEEDDQQEFFESLEDIPSSSDAESGGESKRRSNESQDGMADDQMGSGFSVTRYEIWKSNPGSISERRRRLLSQMGLKLERQESEIANGSSDTASPVSRSWASSPIREAEIDANLIGPGRSATRNSGVSEMRSGFKQQIAGASIAREAGSNIVRSRSDGTFSRLKNGHEMEESSLRLARSGTTSPVLPQRGYERLVDASGAVLRTASSDHSYPASKPPLGVKRPPGTSPAQSRSFTEGIHAQRSQSDSSNPERVKSTGRNGNFSLDSRSLDGQHTGERLQRCFQNGRFSIESSEEAEDCEDGDALCKIKDLDSGKEFIVSELGEDGLWYKLRELDTGRELTLEEFETSLGLSPIVQELMRRENATDVTDTRIDGELGSQKKKRGWLKAIKGVVRGSREKGSHSHYGSGSDDREVSRDKSGRRSGSATDDSQDSPLQSTKRIKVRAHKKATKEFAELHLRQEFKAHQGAIWTMKFSPDGFYLATAGQDRIVRVWEVFEQNTRARESPGTSGELSGGVEKLIMKASPQREKEVKKSLKSFPGRKKAPASTFRLPKLFTLSEIPKCAFEGHTEDILDLSWSPAQPSLLSSSMDKTVRLWNVLRRECLRIFTHNDYVTCIQFNPANDGYFISGSLDGKVRIWSIQERQVVDWADLREMVTAACYTPNGQGAVVGSYKGTCRIYKTSGNKLQLDRTFEVQNNKSKRSHGKKITGFQFIPGDQDDKVLITSSDSRIRVYDGTEISSKYKGFRNTKSQISASFSYNGRYIICASEDSRVCIWNYHDSTFGYPGRQKEESSYEDFPARHVLVAIPWPGISPQSSQLNFGEQKLLQKRDSPMEFKKDLILSERKLIDGDNSPVSTSSSLSDLNNGICSKASSFNSISPSDSTSGLTAHENKRERMNQEAHHEGFLICDGKASSISGGMTPSVSDSYLEDSCGDSIFSKDVPTQQVGSHGFFSDSKGSATWPEEKLPPVQQTSNSSVELTANIRRNAAFTEEDGIDKSVTAIASAWGLVIVTAGLGGEIQAFQNYSFPV